jgi:glycosyl transferase family 2
MTPVTLVMPYYENYGMLLKHYETIYQLPDNLRDLLHVVIVDDGSPKAPALPPERGLRGVALQIYRMKQDIRWNQDACRNIGVRHAETEWVLMTDIDHLVPEKTWRQILLRQWDAAFAYRFHRVSAPDLLPYKVHPNSWLMQRKKFDEAGGYDERFAGYYGTDADFRDRVEKVCKMGMIKENIIRFPRTVIPDASTTTYLRKQPEDNENIRRIKLERSLDKDPRPVRYRFEYDRVFPQGVK